MGAGTYVDGVTGSTGLVEGTIIGYFSQLSQLAGQAYNNASGYAYRLSSYAAPDVDIPMPDITFNAIEILDIPLPDIEANIAIPVFPAFDAFTGEAPNTYTPGVAPEFTDTAPSINLPAAPIYADPQFTASLPVIDAIVIPDAPTFEQIAVPEFYSLSLPDAPTIGEHAFAAVAPAFDFDVPDIGIAFYESPNMPELAGLQERLTALLARDYDAAETAIWERGQERVARTIEENAVKLFDDFAQRGFTMPSGVLLEAQMELRAKGTDQLADNAREAMIKAAEFNLSKLTLAIQTGVAYQGQWYNYEGQRAQRAFEAQRATVELGVTLFNARVQMFNARMTAYQVEAQVYGEMVRAEASKVSLFKAEVDAEIAKGEVNEQRVRAYVAQHQALSAKADAYRALVSGHQARAEVEKTKIDIFRGEVEAFTALVQSKTEQFKAYGEQVRGETAKVGVYEAQARAFAAKVDGFRAGEDAKAKAAQVEIERARVIAENYRSMIAGISQQTSAMVDNVRVQASIYDTQMKGYQAKAAVYEASGRVAISQAQVDSQRMLSAAEVMVRRAQLIADASLRAAALEQQGIEAAGRTSAQLAASAMSAINVGASMSSSVGMSLGNSLTESWSGQL